MRITDILTIHAGALGKHIHVVERKTKKFRTVEISDELLEDLTKYRGCWYDVESLQWLFKSYVNPLKHYPRMTFHRKLKKVGKELGIDCSAHSARKLYAKNIFEKTKDIEAVRKAMNHKYMITTIGYLDIDLRDLIMQALSR